MKAAYDNELQNLKVENNRLKQILQDMNNKGGADVEQWKAIIEQEKIKSEQAKAQLINSEKQIKV